MDVPDMFGAIAGVTVFMMIFMTVAVIAVIVWAFRRVAPAMRDPAEQELRDRLAKGEIDLAEFQARLDTLRQGDHGS